MKRHDNFGYLILIPQLELSFYFKVWLQLYFKH